MSDGTPVEVTITVTIGATRREFNALAVSSNPHSAARALNNSLGDDADAWIRNRLHDARHGR
jgi:hypothetical protein